MVSVNGGTWGWRTVNEGTWGFGTMVSVNEDTWEYAGVMGCGAAVAIGLAFVCFVVINPRVLSANRGDLGFLFLKFSNFTPQVQSLASHMTRYGSILPPPPCLFCCVPRADFGLFRFTFLLCWAVLG